MERTTCEVSQPDPIRANAIGSLTFEVKEPASPCMVRSLHGIHAIISCSI